MNDWELLQEWAARRTEMAFDQIVHRHIEFVHACAPRQVEDPTRAEEVPKPCSFFSRANPVH